MPLRVANANALLREARLEIAQDPSLIGKLQAIIMAELGDITIDPGRSVSPRKITQINRQLLPLYREFWENYLGRSIDPQHPGITRFSPRERNMLSFLATRGKRKNALEEIDILPAVYNYCINALLGIYTHPPSSD